MLAIHPIIQFSMILLALYVFYLGLQRFRSLHLSQVVPFQRKQHAILGIIVLVTWLLGLLGGMSMVYLHWHKFLMTGIHGKVALVMIPFILFGLSTGLYMDHIKKKPKLLPPLHGLNNVIILILALNQVVTGLKAYNSLVLGN